jgi:tumor protein p53-inducible protein 3
MRAVQIRSPGGPEVLFLGDVPEPEPGATELLLDVAATALNRADLLQRRGLYPPPPGCTEILGLECAGVVVRAGADADPGWVGRRVMALLPGGGYAERVAIPERMAVPIPDNLDFAHAAAVPEAFMTANEALFERARLEPAEVVLIHAAAGGVGSAAVQLAHCHGARVVGLASGPQKCRFVTELGAECVDRQQVDWEAGVRAHLGTRGADVILDFVGSAHWPAHSRLLARGGRVVVLGGLGGSKPAEVDLMGLLRQQHSLLGMVMRSRSVTEKVATTRRFVRSVLPLLESERVKPLVHSVFALQDVCRAHEQMEANVNLGKIVLEVGQAKVQIPRVS